MSAPNTWNGIRRRRNEINRIKQATEAAQRSEQKTPSATTVSPVEVQRLKALVQAQMAVRERVQSGCYDHQRGGDMHGCGQQVEDPLMSDMVKACSALMKAMPATQGSSPMAKQPVQQAKPTMDSRKRIGSGASPQNGSGYLQVDAPVFVPRPQYAEGGLESATSTFSPLPFTPQRTPPGLMLPEFTLAPAAESRDPLLMWPPGLERLSDAQVGLRNALSDLGGLSALGSFNQSSGTQPSIDSPSVSRNAGPQRVSMESLQSLTRAGGGKHVGQDQPDRFLQTCTTGISEKEQRVLAKLMNHVKSERNASSSCMFLCRGLHDLGVDSQNALIDHFSKYGGVQGVYVAHTKGVVPGDSFKSVIPGDLGIVVMQAAGAVMRIFGDGDKQYVKGLTVIVQPIVAEPSSPLSMMGRGKCPPISEISFDPTTASASGSGSGKGSTSEDGSTD